LATRFTFAGVDVLGLRLDDFLRVRALVTLARGLLFRATAFAFRGLAGFLGLAGFFAFML
jgi:hypothetical protein